MTVKKIGSGSSEVAFTQRDVMESSARNASEAISAVLVRRDKPQWVDELCSRLDSFRGLLANWDSYGALPPEPASIEIAKLLLSTIGEIVGIERPNVEVSPAGNVAMSWEFGDHKRNLDIEILGTGVIRFAYLNEEDESADQEGTTSDPLVIASILTRW